MTIIELSNKAKAVGLYLTADNGALVKLVKIDADDKRYKNNMVGLDMTTATIIINTLYNAIGGGLSDEV